MFFGLPLTFFVGGDFFLKSISIIPHRYFRYRVALFVLLLASAIVRIALGCSNKTASLFFEFFFAQPYAPCMASSYKSKPEKKQGVGSSRAISQTRDS